MPTLADASGLAAIAARSAIILVWLVVGMRVMGKRQLGQMNLYDLALVMALANSVQNAMTEGKGDLAVGLVSAGVLLLGGRLLAAILVRGSQWEAGAIGTPTVVIQDGELVRDHLSRERVTEDQVLTALRQHGLTDPAAVKLAVLEVDGSLSVVPRDTKPNDRRKP